MSDRFTIRLDDAELRSALDRAAGRLADAAGLLGQVGAVMEGCIQRRFEAKVDPAGVPWPPLASRTRKAYAKADGERRRGTLLERTGRLRASLGHNVAGDAVEVGFGVPYAAYHETGTRTKQGAPKMPRRGLLTAEPEAGLLGAGDREALLALLARYLDRLFD